jgi:hypothetical protein
MNVLSFALVSLGRLNATHTAPLWHVELSMDLAPVYAKRYQYSWSMISSSFTSAGNVWDTTLVIPYVALVDCFADNVMQSACALGQLDLSTPVTCLQADTPGVFISTSSSLSRWLC